MTPRETILASKTPTVVAVDTGTWGTVHLRVMSGHERDSWEAECFHRKEGEEITAKPYFRARLLVRSLCDQGGVRQFKDDEAALLADVDSRLLATLYTKAFELNELGKDDVEAAKNG